MNPVDAWFDAYEAPLKPLMLKVREAILASDPAVSECIKWSTPTFEYKGPIASFNPRSKAHVSLLFHKGATIPGDFTALEGDGAQARTMKFADETDLEAKRTELGQVVTAWRRMKDGAA